MNRTRIVFLGALLSLQAWDLIAAGMSLPAKPVALVYVLTGKATVASASERPRPLHLFDRLAAGATLDLGAGSRLALAFANGRRFELGEHSQVTLGRASLTYRSGPVRPLVAVPSFPGLVPIANEDQPGGSAGAVRIRGERIRGLYPRHGISTLADATILRFEPVDGAAMYRIEVQDRQGTLAFAEESAATEIKLRPGLLQPNRHYRWTVRTSEGKGPSAMGDADFTTLPRDIARAREELRTFVERSGDGELLALLAEIDRSLGLFAEARGERRSTARVSGDDAPGTEPSPLDGRLPYLQSP